MHRRRAEPHVRAIAAAVGGIVGAGLMGGIGYAMAPASPPAPAPVRCYWASSATASPRAR